MALSLEMIRLGRVVLCLLLLTQLVFFGSSSILFSILSSHWIPVRILVSLLILMLSLLGFASLFPTWLIGKRHLYSYSWFGYTGVLIFNIMLLLPLYLLVVHTEQDNLFGPKVFFKVLLLRNDADRQECNHDMYISLGITLLLWSDFSINISG